MRRLVVSRIGLKRKLPYPPGNENHGVAGKRPQEDTAWTRVPEIRLRCSLIGVRVRGSVACAATRMDPGAIETLLREELDAVLQAARYAREATERGVAIVARAAAGQMATSVGPTLVTVPRARLLMTPAPRRGMAVDPAAAVSAPGARDRSITGRRIFGRREYAAGSWGVGPALKHGADYRRARQPGAPLAAGRI